MNNFFNKSNSMYSQNNNNQAMQYNEYLKDLERIKINYGKIYSENLNSQFILPLYSSERIFNYSNSDEINQIYHYFNSANPYRNNLVTEVCFGIKNVLNKIKRQEENINTLQKNFAKGQEISEDILRNLLENWNKNLEIISRKKYEIILKVIEILKIRNKINKSKNINSLDYLFEHEISVEIKSIKNYFHEYKELLKKIEKVKSNLNKNESDNLNQISYEVIELIFKKVNDLFVRINKLID